MNRRLYRCRHDKRIAGVASGVAEYFDADPTLVRLLWVLSVLFGGAGLFLYIAMAIIVPLEPEVGFVPGPPTATNGDPAAEATGAAAVPSSGNWHAAAAAHSHANRGTGRGMTIVGIILILFGALALVEAFLPSWADGGRFVWPAFILGIGAILVASAVRRESTDS